MPESRNCDNPFDRRGEAIRATHLIWVDWIAGAVVGLLVLSLRGWLTDLYALPANLILVIGVANVAYSCVSFTLAMASRGGRVPFLRVAAMANVAWAIGCFVMAAVWFGEASVFGLGQLLGEAVFVGALGVLEWRAGNPKGDTDGGEESPR